MLRCPRCRKGLKSKVAAGVEIDLCIACEGAWFDAGELLKILESDANLQTSPLAASWHGAPAADQDMTCPVCERGLERGPLSAGGMPLHFCPARCGTWLDDGELKPLTRAFSRSVQDAKSKSALRRFVRLLLGRRLRA